MPQPLFILLIVVLTAAFLQTLSGFGFALMAMPPATLLLGIHTAAPLVAVVALALNIVNVMRFRRELRRDELLRLGVPALAGVPAGIWLLHTLDEAVITGGLGVMLAAYALYSLARPAALHPISRRWAYPVGFGLGCLGGAYNLPGPPLILYGSLRQWPHDQFRAVLHALFVIAGALTVLAHSLTGSMTADVLRDSAILIPVVFLGSFTAARFDNSLAPQHLRRGVMALIFVLGLTLIF